LELSKLRVTAHNVYSSSPAERWAYFLQHAEQLTQSDISRLFPDEEIAEAAGVLEMISQTPEQRLLYNARLKFQRDEESRLRHARQEGESRGRQEGWQEGEARGLQIGRIPLLQEMLGQPPSTVEELAGCSHAQLNDMAEQLQRQLHSRR
jgi:flagellar biosynthesis/type III secretory pathway protein FliH